MKIHMKMNITSVLLIFCSASLMSVSASTPAFASDMAFELRGNGGNCDTCSWLSAEGEITSDTPQKFANFVSKLDKEWGSHVGYTVYLDSPGGSLAAGLKLGELFRSYKYKTGVARSVSLVSEVSTSYNDLKPATCASACAFAFLGGESRYATAGEVGVHQFFQEAALSNPSNKAYDAFDLSEQQFISAVLIDYVFRMGVDPRFASISAATPPSQIKFLSTDELVELKVAWEPREFQPWTIEPHSTGVVAVSKSTDQTIVATVFCRQNSVPQLLIIDNNNSGLLIRMQEAIASLQGIEVFGLEKANQKVKARQVGVGVGFEIAMDGFVPAKIDSKKTLDVIGNTSHSNQWLFNYRITSSKAAQAIGVALRNCF